MDIGGTTTHEIADGQTLENATFFGFQKIFSHPHDYFTSKENLPIPS